MVTVAATVPIVTSLVGGGGPSTPVGRPGTGPPAVAVPVTITVPVIVPVTVVPSTGTTRTFAAFTRRGASFVAPNRGRGVLGPLESRVSIALKQMIRKMRHVHVVIGVFGVTAIAKLDKSITARDPVWRLLDVLRQPRHLLGLSEALHGSGISTDEFNQWKFMLHESSIVTIPHETLQHAPSWVVLYLISNKVRSSQQAHGPMLDLVYTHLDTAPTEIHGPLILLAAMQLAQFNLVVPLRSLAQTFLTTWIDDPSPYFNLFLRIISCIPNRTVESANIVVLLLKAMDSRQLKLTSDTYEALLNDRFVTLQLTKYLQTRMTQEGFVPQVSHLEAYLRFFAKDGAIHDARRYHKAIRSQQPPPDSTTPLLSPSSVPQIRANNLMLSTSTSIPSAFTFLHNLVSKKISPHIPPTVVLPIISKRRKTRIMARLLRTKFLNVHDFTTTLCVAVRDPHCTSVHLIKLFSRAPGGRPTVVTYTILIRGLLFRGDTVNAVAYWKKLLKSGASIDSEALATGVVALTRIGRPEDAFTLLEEFGSHPPDLSFSSSKSPSIITLRKPVKITQKTINDFMVALNRIHRPDIVFRIWDHMDRLYGVQPNALSLSILLQSARLAHRLDDTLSGALAQLSLKNPFRRSKRKFDTTATSSKITRDEAVSSIHTLLHSSSIPQPQRLEATREGYTSGIWHDMLPADAVRKIFLQTLFGMVVEQERGEEKVREMLNLESPAAAVRKSVDDDPAEGRIDDLFLHSPSPTSLTPLPQQNAHRSAHPPNRPHSHYPSIILTNSTCLQYILLLILSSRSNEIPLLLAWMRFIGIQPSNSIIALSLAAWSEVSVAAPLVERFNQRRYEGREYVRLVEWIKDWVGERRIPGLKEVMKWSRIVENVRERRE
ncbi:hypothetical protein AN958_11507 [Leucoagaricus sp. SymC.cos]|nr:hypothetical protein AN958_11507 [Leucoagaricus sp. SymC.cos]